MKIAAYRKKLAELDRLKSEVEKMEKSVRMKKELGFINDINKVLKKHSKTVADLAIAFPEAKAMGAKNSKSTPAKKTAKKRVRKSPPTRKFKHPKTGAVIRAKRTNNKELKAWAADLGVKVESLEVK